jgi:hypothetical protein
MAESSTAKPKPKPNPEPAEGQVPAGDYEPVTTNKLPKKDESGKPVNDVAKEVIAGHWGRGQSSKKRLQAAGYDVAAVSEEIKNIFNQK